MNAHSTKTNRKIHLLLQTKLYNSLQFWLKIHAPCLIRWVWFTQLEINKSSSDMLHEKTDLKAFVVVTLKQVLRSLLMALGWQQPSQAFFWYDMDYEIKYVKASTVKFQSVSYQKWVGASQAIFWYDNKDPKTCFSVTYFK